MPEDAYWAVACIALAFCLALSLIYNVRERAESGKLKSDLDEMFQTQAELLSENKTWEDAYISRSEQLEATRIALVEAQKNDHRDERGRFVKV